MTIPTNFLGSMMFHLTILFCVIFQFDYVKSLNVTTETITYSSDVPVRLQWLPNDGYCGEVSTIASGLKFGQYFSQYDIRDIAAVSNQNVQTQDFYLVGTNDQRTADLIKLNAIEFDHRDYSESHTETYLAWIKAMTRKGFPVTMTVFMNYYLYYGITKADAGDPIYDHIVSVLSVTSKYDDDNYHDDDVISFSDHGLWAPRSNPQYVFNYTFKEFQGDREQANAKLGNIYSVPCCTRNVGNFGIVHTGVVDIDGDLLPVRVDTDVNYESPSIENRSEERPPPMAVKLTVTVSDVQPGVSYVLYKYTDENKVPSSSFNAAKGQASMAINFIGAKDSTVYLFSETIMSNEKAIFRAVRSDAK